MKPIGNITGEANLLALIRDKNPRAELTLQNVTLGPATPRSGTDKSKVKVTAVVDRGYSGEVTVSYTRSLLSNYIRQGTYIQLDEGGGRSNLLEKLASDHVVVNDVNLSGYETPGVSTGHMKIVTLTSMVGYIFDETEQLDIVISYLDPATTTMRGVGSNQYRVDTMGRARGFAA